MSIPNLYTIPGISVPVAELFDSMSEGADQNGVYATKQYLVRWADRWAFYADMAGRARIYGKPPAEIIRKIPYQYPDNVWLYANALKMVPEGKIQGGIAGRATYDYARVTVDFATLQWAVDAGQDQNGNTFRTEKLGFSAEFLTLPEGSYQFIDGTPVNQAPGVIIPTAELSITSHHVPWLPFGDILAMIGGINAGPFYTAPTGTMLFLGAQSSRTATIQGYQAWEVEWKFQYRPYDWNMLKHPSKPGFVFFYQKIGKDNPYPKPTYKYVDFSALPL